MPGISMNLSQVLRGTPPRWVNVLLWLVLAWGVLYVILLAIGLVGLLALLALPNLFPSIDLRPADYEGNWAWLEGLLLLAAAGIGWYCKFKGRFKTLWLIMAGIGILQVCLSLLAFLAEFLLP